MLKQLSQCNKTLENIEHAQIQKYSITCKRPCCVHRIFSFIPVVRVKLITGFTALVSIQVLI